MDPHNLLNPGKLDFATDASMTATSVLPTRGWTFRKAAGN
jgi:hypothetical protein